MEALGRRQCVPAGVLHARGRAICERAARAPERAAGHGMPAARRAALPRPGLQEVTAAAARRRPARTFAFAAAREGQAGVPK